MDEWKAIINAPNQTGEAEGREQCWYDIINIYNKYSFLLPCEYLHETEPYDGNVYRGFDIKWLGDDADIQADLIEIPDLLMNINEKSGKRK